MKNEKITRDTVKQNEYKNKLKQESVKYYGTEKCYASHRQYKGLIASHIKPYKICALEGDIDSEFDIDNGLLLSKNIDDYFDKLLITFDNDGKIICSNYIPDDIKREFSDYKLDDFIFNEKRKQYMRIHRSLFFYKNNVQAFLDNGVTKLDNIQIPYLDNGIKVYKNSVIVNNNGFWSICEPNKVKRVFIERSNATFEPKYYITNADFFNKLLQQKEYSIDEIPSGFNCLNNTYDINDLSIIKPENQFKLNKANYNLNEKKPECFLQLMRLLFSNDNNSIENFRKIVKLSLIGNGCDKNIVFIGNKDSLSKISYVLHNVLGSYVYLDYDIKNLKQNNTSKSIPNCYILLFSLKASALELIDKSAFEKIRNNTFYVNNILNINKYVPFYFIENKKGYIDNAVYFKLMGETICEEIDSIIESEGDRILYWFLTANIDNGIETGIDSSYENSKDYEKIQSVAWKRNSIIEWLNTNCIISSDKREKTSATILYNDYENYYNQLNNSHTTVSRRMFCIILSEYLKKKRCSAGILYLGIKLRNNIIEDD